MEKRTRKSSALANFAKTLTVKVDGMEVAVPVGQAENKFLNCVIISQMRQMLQENLKKIKDTDAIITPRELKDLVDSIARMAEASGEIYSTAEGSIPKAPVQATAIDAETSDEIDLADITQKPNGNTSTSNDTGPSGSPAQ